MTTNSVDMMVDIVDVVQQFLEAAQSGDNVPQEFYESILQQFTNDESLVPATDETLDSVERTETKAVSGDFGLFDEDEQSPVELSCNATPSPTEDHDSPSGDWVVGNRIAGQQHDTLAERNCAQRPK